MNVVLRMTAGINGMMSKRKFMRTQYLKNKGVT